MRKAIEVDESTEISIDDARSYNHFLRVTAGPARLDLSLTTASALHDMLNAYFDGDPDPVDAEVAYSSDEVRAMINDGVLDGRFDRLREAEAA